MKYTIEEIEEIFDNYTIKISEQLKEAEIKYMKAVDREKKLTRIKKLKTILK